MIYKTEKIVGILVLAGIGMAVYAAHIPVVPSDDIVARLENDIQLNDKRIDLLLASPECKKFVPTSYHCAKSQAELAGLRAQNFSLKTSVIALKGKDKFSQMGQRTHNDARQEQVESLPIEQEVHGSTVGGGLRKVGEGAGDVVRGIGQGIANIFR